MGLINDQWSSGNTISLFAPRTRRRGDLASSRRRSHNYHLAKIWNCHLSHEGWPVSSKVNSLLGLNLFTTTQKSPALPHQQLVEKTEPEVGEQRVGGNNHGLCKLAQLGSHLHIEDGKKTDSKSFFLPLIGPRLRGTVARRTCSKSKSATPLFYLLSITCLRGRWWREGWRPGELPCWRRRRSSPWRSRCCTRGIACPPCSPSTPQTSFPCGFATRNDCVFWICLEKHMDFFRSLTIILGPPRSLFVGRTEIAKQELFGKN